MEQTRYQYLQKNRNLALDSQWRTQEKSQFPKIQKQFHYPKKNFSGANRNRWSNDQDPTTPNWAQYHQMNKKDAFISGIQDNIYQMKNEIRSLRKKLDQLTCKTTSSNNLAVREKEN